MIRKKVKIPKENTNLSIYKFGDIGPKSELEEISLGNRLLKWVVILAPILFMYFLTFGRGPILFADSLELITAGKLGSLAHPPGYALQTLILWMATSMVPLNLTALVANLMGALLQIMTLIVFVKVVEKWALARGLSCQKSLIIAGLSAWMLGFSRYFWFSAGVFEVFVLNNLFIINLIFIELKFYEDKKSVYKFLLWGFVAGLAIGHQQLVILIVVPWSLFILFKAYRDRRFSSGWAMLGGIVIGLVVSVILVYLIGIRGSNALVSWRMNPSLEGVWQIVSRADYSGTLIDQMSESHAYWKGLNVGESLKGLVEYTKLIIENFTLVGFVLLIWSVYTILKSKNDKWLKLILFLWLISGPILVMYLPIVSDRGNIDYQLERILVERMYTQGYLLTALLIGIGLINLIKVSNKKESLILGILMILVTIIQIGENYKYANVSKLTQPWQTLVQTMEDLPQNTVLFCFGDWSCFGTLYAQAIENIRNDILIVPVTPQIHTAKLNNLNLMIGYPDNPWRISEIVGWARNQNRQIAFMELSEIYERWLGLDEANGYISSGPGLAVMWSCQDKKNNYVLETKNDAGLTAAHEYSNSTMQLIHDSQTKFDRKNKYIENVIEIPDENNLGKKVNDLNGKLNKLKDTKCLTSIELSNLARLCSAKNLDCAFPNYLQAIMLEPNNYQIRLNFAEYLLPRAPELAKREYRLVLRTDSENSLAKMRLSELKSVIDLPWSL